MNRERMLAELRGTGQPWDVVIVGGGATGLGCALDAAARGYRTALFEARDFGSGTSSRSTKLIHGGVRYLKRGNVFLVAEALRERGLLLRNAPHLISPIPFLIPAYRFWERPWYGAGLLLYGALAGSRGIGATRILSREQTQSRASTLSAAGLRGSVLYHDAQFDDARLAITLARTAAGLGAVLVNYARVTGILKRGSAAAGVAVEDAESGETYEVPARVVINAAGVFADEVRRLDEPDADVEIRPSRGVHVVIDRSFLPGENAVLIPRTDDGRVLFLVPWEGRVLLGTTDTPVAQPTPEPTASPEEIDFLLAHAARYLDTPPRRADVRAVFAGLRPLIGADAVGDDTSSLSRKHRVVVSLSAMVSVLGGKWTTYRKMAEDAVDQAAFIGGLVAVPSNSHNVVLAGGGEPARGPARLVRYGSDAARVAALETRYGADALHPGVALTEGEVRWFVEHEMARTVEDVLARRTRALVRDARSAAAAAPAVAGLLARVGGFDGGWIERQVDAFTALAHLHLPGGEDSAL